jgi:hypothetical protein
MDDIKKVVLSYVKTEKKMSKNGKPYTSLSVKIQGEEFFRNGFCNENDPIARASAGDTVLLRLFEEEWNGTMQPKVSVPRKEDIIMVELQRLTKRVEALEGIRAPAATPEPVFQKPEEVDISDLPF